MPLSSAEKSRLYLQRHPEKRLARYACVTAIRKDRTALMQRIKAERGCLYCGTCHPLVLDFHHRNPADKSFTISQIPTTNIPKLLAEVEKCDVVCRNCHMLVHAGIDPSSWIESRKNS